jgi:hypothetical protein
LLAPILSPISANFEWIASARLRNCELSRHVGPGGARPGMQEGEPSR